MTGSIRASFTTHLVLALKQQTQHILLYTRIYFEDANPEDNCEDCIHEGNVTALKN